MPDIASISAIVIASLTALGSCLVALHIKRLRSGCMECETEEQKLASRQNSVKEQPQPTLQK